MRLKLKLVAPNGAVMPTAITAEATATVAHVAAAVQAGLSGQPVAAETGLSFELLADDFQGVGALIQPQK